MSTEKKFTPDDSYFRSAKIHRSNVKKRVRVVSTDVEEFTGQEFELRCRYCHALDGDDHALGCPEGE